MIYQQVPFFRKFSVRLPSMLAAPRHFALNLMQLPRDSVLHYFGESEADLGPSEDNVFVRKTAKQVFIRHITDLSSNKGNPKPNYVQPGPLMQDYRRNHRKLRPLMRWDTAARDPLNLIVINYAMLSRMRRYVTSFFRTYYKWYNIFATAINTANEIGAVSDRQQFFTLELDDQLPTITDLRRAERSINRNSLKNFRNATSLTILDLWTWLGRSRHNSILSNLDPETVRKTDFIVSYYGEWIVFNLGVLDSWRRSETNPAGLDPRQLQLRFMRMLNILKESVSEVAITADDLDKLEQDAAAHKAPVEGEEHEEEAPHEDEGELIAKQLDELEQTQPIEEELIDLDALAAAEGEEEDDSDVEYQLGDDEDIYETSRVGSVGKAVGTDELQDSTGNAILAKANELAKQSQITAADYRRLVKLSTIANEVPDPYGSEQSIVEASVITAKDLELKPTKITASLPMVLDKSMLESTVGEMDSLYVENVLRKDILQAVLSVQNAAVAVTNYDVEVVQDAVSDYEIHTVTLVPVVGRQSTIRFRVPRVKPNGVYISNGTKYRLRKQKVDLPIRKVTPVRVALSSAYAKIFVEKTERSRFNYDRYIGQRVVAIGLDDNNPAITDIKLSDVFDYRVKAGNIYSVLAGRVASFRSGNMLFYFDYSNRAAGLDVDPDRVAKIERSGIYVVCGKQGDRLIVVDRKNVFYVQEGSGALSAIGTIEDIAGIDPSTTPVQMAELKVFGKSIPLGMVLGYQLGFQGLVERLGAKYRRVLAGERLQLSPDEYVIRFSDESWVFNRADANASLILSGFNLYATTIKTFAAAGFERKDIYAAVLDRQGIGTRYTREFDLMTAMFVDPITRDILTQMREPTDFNGLLIRASELLMTRYVPNKLDGVAEIQGMERCRGYERFAGAVYSELVKSMRQFNTRTVVGNATISMNPHAVWTTIVQDPAASVVDDINPIHNLKEKEVITYGGTGGRSRRSMTADARLFDESEIGFISEATVDSGDVAIITYMVPNANITSLRGTVRMFDPKTEGPSSIISTCALLAPSSDRDDPKRTNFVTIQQSHGIQADGYRATPYRTGYEHVIAHRVDGTFATAAKQGGKVISVGKQHMVIEYADGTRTNIQLGRTFGISNGKTIPNEMVTRLSAGDAFNEGDILVYHAGYFEPSYFMPNQVAWKAGVMARTAITEGWFTIEDSSSINERLAKLLNTQITTVEVITARFDQKISRLVKPGDVVDLDTPLCYIEDVLGGTGLFDDDKLDTLKALSAMVPRAGVVGVVERVEWFYHGELDDINENLRPLVEEGDRERKKLDRMLDRPVTTGKVDQSLRIEGDGLEMDHVAIRVYITKQSPMGLADKLVVANQMKSVLGNIHSDETETEFGEGIDLMFGAKSIQDRIVNSPMLIGSTNTLLRVIGEKASKIYFGTEAE